MNEAISSFFNFLTSHTTEQWERFLVWVILMTISYFILYREDEEMRRGLKGSDKLWQSPEGFVYIFLWILPGMVITSFCLKYDIDTKIMYIIETILLVALGIRGAIDGVKYWKSTKDEGTKPPAE